MVLPKSLTPQSRLMADMASPPANLATCVGPAYAYRLEVFALVQSAIVSMIYFRIRNGR
jgi:hypothetical protein